MANRYRCESCKKKVNDEGPFVILDMYVCEECLKEIEDGLDERAVMIVPVLEAFPAEAPTETGGGGGWAYAAFAIAIVALVLGAISLARKRG